MREKQQQQTEQQETQQQQPLPLHPNQQQPPLQQDGPQDKEHVKKFHDCEDRLCKLRDDLEKAKRDLEGARAKNESTVCIYAEMQRINEEIICTKKECEKPVVDNSKLPDLSFAQNIISTSVVRRKDKKALTRSNVH